MSDRLARGLTLLLTAAGAVGALWLAVRFLLPWTAPFLAAWILAAALEAPVGFLVRRGWRRGAAAGLCTLLALGLLLWGLAALVWKGVGALTDFVQQLPGQMEQVQARLAALQSAAERGIRSAPAGSGSNTVRRNGSSTAVSAARAVTARSTASTNFILSPQP